MAVKGVQQIMLGPLLTSEKAAAEVLRKIRSFGYDGIELNSYMIHKTAPIVRILTRAAGMPAGRGGSFDWPALVRDAGLEVIALHTDLGSLRRDPEAVMAEADRLGTHRLVITGMYRFDYSDRESVAKLADSLNQAGKTLKESGMRLLYHNHNAEFRRLAGPDKADGTDRADNSGGADRADGADRTDGAYKTGEADKADRTVWTDRTERTHGADDGAGASGVSRQTSYDYLLDHTDPEYVGFEFDSYWPTEAGVNTPALMRRLGSRMELWHVTDRGTRVLGASLTPILKSDTVEPGYGCMDLPLMASIAAENHTQAAILETHRNFIDHSPLRSIEISSEFMLNCIQ